MPVVTHDTPPSRVPIEGETYKLRVPESNPFLDGIDAGDFGEYERSKSGVMSAIESMYRSKAIDVNLDEWGYTGDGELRVGHVATGTYLDLSKYPGDTRSERAFAALRSKYVEGADVGKSFGETLDSDVDNVVVPDDMADETRANVGNSVDVMTSAPDESSSSGIEMKTIGVVLAVVAGAAALLGGN